MLLFDVKVVICGNVILLSIALFMGVLKDEYLGKCEIFLFTSKFSIILLFISASSMSSLDGIKE